MLPGTIAVGIDPDPRLTYSLDPSTRVFPTTSDEFFASHDLREELGNKPVDLAFIDGMHLFEFALRDFINVERNCHAGSVVLVHDCYPLDPVTSSRTRTPGVWWSGDIWKLIVCLRDYRPELRVNVVDVQPTGLGVVSNLDPSSTVLTDNYDEILDRYIDAGYESVADDKANMLRCVPDDWSLVRELLPDQPFRHANRLLLVGRRAARWRRGKASTAHRDIRLGLTMSPAAPALRALKRSRAARG